ncbi:MAG: nucleotidyltransferase domain-containing protein [Thiobacillaceae bacterium]
MRLTDTQRTMIREEVRQHFGDGARVLLFGSRVRDETRGGDIDLYLEAEGTAAETLARELKLYAALQRRLGEQRIDIVVHRRDTPMRAIDLAACQTGMPL